eukprot:scaffold3795_cov126-Isochrysis_galbana.AAC.7
MLHVTRRASSSVRLEARNLARIPMAGAAALRAMRLPLPDVVVQVPCREHTEVPHTRRTRPADAAGGLQIRQPYKPDCRDRGGALGHEAKLITSWARMTVCIT